MVRLTSTPTMIRTIPRIIATSLPVSSTMTANNFQIAAKGQRYHGICFECVVMFLSPNFLSGDSHLADDCHLFIRTFVTKVATGQFFGHVIMPFMPPRTNTRSEGHTSELQSPS